MTTDRAAWLAELRRDNERQEDSLVDVFDEEWGAIADDHRAWIDRFLALLPPDGRVLDAPCGTGKYFGLVVGSGRPLLGVDHAGAYLALAAAKFPDVPTEKHDLQDMPYRDAFDGVMCIDAMEFVPPEEWPVVLDRFHAALHPGGSLYLTVERSDAAGILEANAAARAKGLPVVDGEVLWDEPDPYYHHYPPMDRVRSWIANAGFAIVDETEGPWHDGGYAYHHILARKVAPAGGAAG